MAFVYRSIGRLRERTQDGVDIGNIIQEFQSAEAFVDKLLSNTKLWRDAWTDILAHQFEFSKTYTALYAPIADTPEQGDAARRQNPVEVMLEPSNNAEILRKYFGILDTELKEDVKLLGRVVVEPLMDVKGYMEPVKKMLKRRENMKLDYERYLKEVERLRRKKGRTDRENAALEKAERELKVATNAYQMEDERFIEWVPLLMGKIANLLPLIFQTLMTAQIAFLYTSNIMMEKVSNETKILQSDYVVDEWEEMFEPIKRHIEQDFALLKGGKAVRMPMSQLAARRDAPPMPERSRRALPPPPPSKPPAAYARPALDGTSAGGNLQHISKTTPPTPRPVIGSRVSNASLNSRFAKQNIHDEHTPPPPAVPGSKPPAMSQAQLHPLKSSLSTGAIRTQKSNSNLSVFEGSVRPQIKRTAVSSSLSPPSAANGRKPESANAQLRPPSSGSAYAKSEVSDASFDDARSQFSYASGDNSTSTVVAAGRGRGGLNSAIENSLSAQLNSRQGNYMPKRPVSPGAKSVVSVAASTYSASTIAAKKKPPPPPPPKPKFPKKDDALYVMALYGFVGQSQGDLWFEEGDRIKVVRKTDSTDDWWEGELDGRRGQFPANYTKTK